MNVKHSNNITTDAMTALTGRGKLVKVCGSVAEFQAVIRNAYRIKKEYPRTDGYDYDISTNAATATVIVRLKQTKP